MFFFSFFVVTNGARAITGTEMRFSEFLKQNYYYYAVIHYIVHQEALCGESLRHFNVMTLVVKITNVIRRDNRALTHRKRPFQLAVRRSIAQLTKLGAQCRGARTFAKAVFPK